MTHAQIINRDRPARKASFSVNGLFHHYSPRPDHPDWPALFSEAQRLAVRIGPSLERPQRLWAFRLRQLHAWHTLLRNHLYNRRLAKQQRQDFLPLYFIWTTHRACNFKCVYCDDHCGHRYPDLPPQGALNTADAIRMLKVMRTHTPSVLFSGGEPTLRSDLPLITRAARELNYFPIILNTNGSLIHKLLLKEEWRGMLADVDHLVVSLDGFDSSLLSKLWGYRNPEQVLCNILLLHELSKERRFKLMISTVIQPEIIEQAAQVLDWSNDLNICFCPMPVNVGASIERSLFETAGYAKLVEKILDRKKAGYPIAGSLRMNHRMLYAQPFQCRNTLKPHVDHDGGLFWPCKPAVTVTPIKIPVLDFENLLDLYEYGNQVIDVNQFHRRCGGRCNWSQHYTTDAYTYGLSNPETLWREVHDFLKAI